MQIIEKLDHQLNMMDFHGNNSLDTLQRFELMLMRRLKNERQRLSFWPDAEKVDLHHDAVFSVTWYPIVFREYSCGGSCRKILILWTGKFENQDGEEEHWAISAPSCGHLKSSGYKCTILPSESFEGRVNALTYYPTICPAEKDNGKGLGYERNAVVGIVHAGYPVRCWYGKKDRKLVCVTTDAGPYSSTIDTLQNSVWCDYSGDEDLLCDVENVEIEMNAYRKSLQMAEGDRLIHNICLNLATPIAMEFDLKAKDGAYEDLKTALEAARRAKVADAFTLRLTFTEPERGCSRTWVGTWNGKIFEWRIADDMNPAAYLGSPAGRRLMEELVFEHIYNKCRDTNVLSYNEVFDARLYWDGSITLNDYQKSVFPLKEVECPHEASASRVYDSFSVEFITLDSQIHVKIFGHNKTLFKKPVQVGDDFWEYTAADDKHEYTLVKHRGGISLAMLYHKESKALPSLLSVMRIMATGKLELKDSFEVTTYDYRPYNTKNSKIKV